MNYLRLCSSKIFFLKEVLLHPKLCRAWRTVSFIERMKHAELEAIQKEKITDLLKYVVKHVPFYQNYAKTNGLHSDALQLTDFPILEKSSIRGKEIEFVSDEFSLRKLSRSRTSGSTGEPFLFYKSKDSFDYTYATLWRGLARYGIRPGDRRVLIKGLDEANQLSCYKKMKRRVYNMLNRCLAIDAHFLAANPNRLGDTVNRVMAYNPDYFHGYASSLYTIARHIEEHHIDVSTLNLKAVVTESEKLHDFQRACLERVFRVPVVENYGSVEFGMIAQPDQAGNLCVNEDHVVVETTPDGEAVITNLHEYGFPLIRFKNGDLLELGEPGGTLPYKTIKILNGRVAEEIHLPNGGKLQGFIVMYPISKHMKWIKSYQVYQPDLEHLVLRFVVAENLPEAVSKQIMAEMAAIVGTQIHIVVEYLSEIPTTKRGKHLFVCSDVKREVLSCEKG